MAGLELTYEKALHLLDIEPFFVSQGLEIVRDADVGMNDKNYVLAKGCSFTNSGYLQVCLSDKVEHVTIGKGDWYDEKTETNKPLLEYIIQNNRLQGSSDENQIAALRIMCEAAKIEMPGIYRAMSNKVVPVHEGLVTQLATQLPDDFIKKLNEHVGISIETIRQNDFGCLRSKLNKSSVLIIPVRERDGIIKSYRVFDSNLNSKWLKCIPDHNKLDCSPKIYGIDKLTTSGWPNVILCNTELERLILMQVKESDEWGAVSILGDFSLDYVPLFKDCNVVVMYSRDGNSIRDVNSVLVPSLIRTAKSVKVVNVPGDGSVNSCRIWQWMKQGGTWAGLVKIIGNSSVIEVEASNPFSEVENLRRFGEIDDPRNMDKHVSVPLAVVGDLRPVYSIPLKFRIGYCSMMEKRECIRCENLTFSLPFGLEEHVEMCGSSRWRKDLTCQRVTACRHKRVQPVIDIIEKGSMRELICTQSHGRLIDRDDSGDILIDGCVRRSAEHQVYVQLKNSDSVADLTQPHNYIATGWVRTDPRNSKVTMLVERMDLQPEIYENFDYSLHRYELKCLRKLGWKGIIDDIVEHRTRIYGRDELAMLVLLTYCSPLRFHFNGERNLRGWIVSAVLGDTGIGKSTTFERLSEVIGIGDIFKCSSGKRTGLLFAMIGQNGGWYRCKAGLYPQNSRKILCVEEPQLLPPEDIGKLADAMNDGILRVDFSDNASYESMTRLIFNCNPRHERTMDSFQYGVQALKELFSSPAFIRRMDMVVFGGKSINDDVFNKTIDPKAEPKVSEDALRSLIFYAWSLTAERIRFGDGVTKLILERANQLAVIYGNPDDIPLVCPADFRKTLARVSVALAVMDMSSTDGFATITVMAQHVEAVVAFFDKIYSHKDCALDVYSAKHLQSKNLADYDLIAAEFTRRLNRELTGTNNFAYVVYSVLTANIHQSHFSNVLKCSNKWLDQTVGFLLNYGLVRPAEFRKRQLVASEKLHKFMKRFEKENPVEYGCVMVAVKDKTPLAVGEVSCEANSNVNKSI